MNRVFVYGTLMSGQPNNYLLRNARLLGRTETRDCFVMLDLYGFPGVVRDGGDGTTIKGEVWECDDETLERLDRLESHPVGYRRDPVFLSTSVGTLHDVPLTVAWMYIFQQDRKGFSVILSGDWRDAVGEPEPEDDSQEPEDVDFDDGDLYDSEDEINQKETA